MQRLTEVRNARQEKTATVVEVAKDMFGNEPGLLNSILSSLETAYNFVLSIPKKVVNAVSEILMFLTTWKIFIVNMLKCFEEDFWNWCCSSSSDILRCIYLILIYYYSILIEAEEGET